MSPTSFSILRVGREPERREHDLPAAPGNATLRELLLPILEARYYEHVSVLHEGRAADMFVDEDGARSQPRNDPATAIYRASWLDRHPSTDPESLPAINGTAILFDRRFWF